MNNVVLKVKSSIFTNKGLFDGLRSSINSVTLPLTHVFVKNKTRWHTSKLDCISIGGGYLTDTGSSSGLMGYEVD